MALSFQEAYLQSLLLHQNLNNPTALYMNLTNKVVIQLGSYSNLLPSLIVGLHSWGGFGLFVCWFQYFSKCFWRCFANALKDWQSLPLWWFKVIWVLVWLHIYQSPVRASFWCIFHSDHLKGSRKLAIRVYHVYQGFQRSSIFSNNLVFLSTYQTFQECRSLDSQLPSQYALGLCRLQDSIVSCSLPLIWLSSAERSLLQQSSSLWFQSSVWSSLRISFKLHHMRIWSNVLLVVNKGKCILQQLVFSSHWMWEEPSNVLSKAWDSFLEYLR